MLLVFVVCSWEPTNSTVVDRELTPWFLWSVDSGSYNGVLLESVDVTVIVWIVFLFLSEKGVALEGQLRFIYHPEPDGLCIAFIAVDFELDLDLWMKNIYREFSKVRDIIFWKIFCTDRCQYLLVSATSSTVFLVFALKVWRSSSWMWSIVCIGGMNVMSKGGVEVCIL